MSRASELWQGVGSFFGISQSNTDTLQQWKNTVERKMKNEEYGIHLHSRGSRTGHSESQFVNQAGKVLSQISVSQAYEEQDEMTTVATDGTGKGQIQSTSKAQHLTPPQLSKEIPSTSKNTSTTSWLEKHSLYIKLLKKKKNNAPDVQKSRRSGSQGRVSDQTHKDLQHLSRQVSVNKLYEPDEELDDEMITEGKAVSVSEIYSRTYKERHVSFSDVDTVEHTRTGQVDSVKGKNTSVTSMVESDSSMDGKKSQSKVKLIFFDELAEQSGCSVDTDSVTSTVEGKSTLIYETASSNVDEKSKTASSKVEENTETTTSKEQDQSEIESPKTGEKSDRTPSKVDEKCKPVSSKDEGQSKTESSVADIGEENADISEGKEAEMDENKEAELTKEAEMDENKKTELTKVETDSLSKKPEELSADDLVYGKDAFTQYNFFVHIEKKAQQLEAARQQSRRIAEYDWKIQAIDELIQLAKAYYTNPQSKTAVEWKELKRRVKRSSSHKITRTEVRHKLDALPEFRPFFTYGIIAVQLLAFCVICCLGGVTYIGVKPHLLLETGIKTFVGTETVHKWTPPNIWIGPEQGQLISVGALFARCMREDFDLQLFFAKFNYSKHIPLGCCEVAFRNTAGTTTEDECDKLTDGVGFWRAGVPCGQRSAGDLGTAHILKPCCVDVKGRCELITYKHCTFLRGQYHLSGPEHCTQVNCMADICTPGSLSSKPDQPWLPEAPNQWWRLPLSLIYHHGAIHVVLCTAAQWLLFRQVEQTAGWLRVMVIYVLAGMAALLTGALFSPDQPHVGSSGAIFGMVGVVIIELVQFWSMVHQPWIEVTKLATALVLFLICGTLPYLDNFSLLSGLIVGMLLAVILLPYITFGKWQTRVRLVLVLTTVPVLFVVMFALFYAFYKVQTFGSCETCKLINCIPYMDTMCNTSLWH